MKSILSSLILVTLITFQLFSQSGWYSQTPKPSGDNLTSVFYLNSTIWAVGGSGNVLKSNDNGSSWESKLIGAHYILSGVHFVDQLNGIVYGVELEYINSSQVNEYGIILTTSDGGSSWALKYRESVKPNGVFFMDQFNGWAVADSGKVFKTTDGGDNWTEYYCGENASLQEVTFLDSQNGWMVGSGIFKTTDGGINWEEVSSINDFFNRMCFLNNNLGWVCGSEMYKTTDGGQNWIQLTYVGYGIWEDIQFIDADIGWCCSYNFSLEIYEILNSSDGGTTWSVQYSNSDIYPSALHFANNNDGVSVGNYGAILTTSNGGNAWDLRTEWILMSLRQVDFPTLDKGFALGRTGSGATATSYVIKSTDGGSNWEVSDSLPNAWYTDLFFIDELKGWIVGGNFNDTTGFINYTDDGGNSWSAQYILQDNGFSSIYFTNELNGWVGMADGNLLHTTNGGSSWELKSTGISTDARKIFFVNDNTGWIIGFGTSHQIIKTLDGGNTWLDITPPDLLDILYDIDFINEQIGWVVGEHGIVLKTTDGGLTWNQSWPEPWPQGPPFHSVDFVNENVGWIVTDGASIFYTTDGGDNWNLQASLKGSNGSIFFHDQQTGWFVGGNNVFGEPKIGYVYKTTTGGVTFIENNNENNTTPRNYFLSQNYPNPFNPSTTISWQSPVGSHQTLKIYDVLGNEVATLVDEYKPAGIYEVEFNSHSDAGRNLSSGIYFYQLLVSALRSKDGKTEGLVETKKMILLK